MALLTALKSASAEPGWSGAYLGGRSLPRLMALQSGNILTG